MALGSSAAETDSGFDRRVERSWKGLYDVRRRQPHMVMQSMFQVQYSSFLSGLTTINSVLVRGVCCDRSILWLIILVCAVEKCSMSCDKSGGCAARVLAGSMNCVFVVLLPIF